MPERGEVLDDLDVYSSFEELRLFVPLLLNELELIEEEIDKLTSRELPIDKQAREKYLENISFLFDSYRQTIAQAFWACMQINHIFDKIEDDEPREEMTRFLAEINSFSPRLTIKILLLRGSTKDAVVSCWKN